MTIQDDLNFFARWSVNPGLIGTVYGIRSAFDVLYCAESMPDPIGLLWDILPITLLTTLLGIAILIVAIFVRRVIRD